MNTIKSLFSFLRNPKDEKDTESLFSTKMKIFALLFGFEVFVMILLAGVINLLDSSGLVDLSEHELGDMMESLPIYVMLLMGVVIIPVLEECIFRFFLRYERNIVLRMIAKITNEEKVLNSWKNNYRFIFYFSAFCFGYAHIFNFGTLSTNVILFSPLLILPQFFMGSVAGYLRVRFGFIWSCALHFCHNLLFIGGAFLAMNTAIEKASISNEKYDMKIEEIALSNIKEKSIDISYQESPDSLELVLIKNYDTEALMKYLLEDKQLNLDIQEKKIRGLKYNIEFTKKEENINPRSEILREFKNLYNIEINTENRMEEAWELIVIDSALLLEHIQIDSSRSFGIEGHPFELKSTFKNFNLKQISFSLNRTYDEYIFTNVDTNKKYNMTLPMKDFQQTKETLKNKYGIELNAEEKNISYTTIRKAGK